MIYADTSAVIKLLVEEQHSDAVEQLYRSTVTTTAWVSSDLLRLELSRSVRRVAPTLLPDVALLLEAFTMIDISRRFVSLAIEEPSPGLRSLDALHVATARVLRPDLEAFVTYDLRQREAALEAGLPCISPGSQS